MGRSRPVSYTHLARLGFRLRGQERFMIPGRKDPLFTEEGIRAAIQGNLLSLIHI